MELKDLLSNAKELGFEVKEENDCVWFIYQENNREHQQFIPKTSNDSKEFLDGMESFLDKINLDLTDVKELKHYTKLRELNNHLKDCLEQGIIVSHTDKFNYMMLSRLQNDCEYYLGNGNRYDKHLWAGNEEAQIEEMKRLYNSFEDSKKPQWISMTDIENYESQMCNDIILQENEDELER